VIDGVVSYLTRTGSVRLLFRRAGQLGCITLVGDLKVLLFEEDRPNGCPSLIKPVSTRHVDEPLSIASKTVLVNSGNKCAEPGISRRETA
jgi:hypothetical protein